MMAVRKLGVFTGLFIIFLLFFAEIIPYPLYIVQFPDYSSPGSSLLTIYAWGFTTPAGAENFLTTRWPGVIISLLTSGALVISAILAISASTPGTIAENAKRQFGIAAVLSLAPILFTTLPLFLSLDLVGFFYNYLGPGFYLLLIVMLANLISFSRVK